MGLYWLSSLYWLFAWMATNKPHANQQNQYLVNACISRALSVSSRFSIPPSLSLISVSLSFSLSPMFLLESLGPLRMLPTR
eukprot:m.41259 g.41259  ORF g.41259 m.41259 type:complete len:81 (+) comp16841_c0_seq1:1019-1261(+)